VTFVAGVTQIAAGWDNTLALSNGQPHWWGRPCGECGYDDPPVLHTIGITNVTRIGAGSYHYLAVRSDGTLWAWGLNDHGQLGDGTINSSNTRRGPAQVLGAGGAVQMDGGANHTVVVVERPIVIGP
jgi:alpha-tubulin suppressor-like RCC1 family protein